MTATAASTAASKTTAMRKGRQADSARRRQRVLDTIAKEAAAGEEISVAGIARAAAVDRTFLYRHRDLLEKIHVLEAVRLTARIRQLEKRLSEALGEQAWHQTGLGAPPDIDTLNQKITYLEQKTAGLQLQLAERNQDLTAARAANRELMTRLNTRS